MMVAQSLRVTLVEEKRRGQDSNLQELFGSAVFKTAALPLGYPSESG
jgi:hypothetical protein